MGSFERVGDGSILAEYEDFQKWHYEWQLEAGFSEQGIQDYPTMELLDAMVEWTDQHRPRE